MIKIGLTGGIGSGKSMVASLFEVFGIPAYIADEESKRLTNTSPVIRDGLTALFGNDLYAGGELDKQRLASLIFTNETNLARVNAIIHPEVNRDFLTWASRQSVPCCLIETAILFESGFDRVVDCSVMVYAPIDLRIQRVAIRDDTTFEAISRRIRNQMPDEEKRNRSDYVIYNDDRQAVVPQVEKLLDELQNCSLKRTIL